MSDRHYPSVGKVFFRSLLAGLLLFGSVCEGQPTITVTVNNPTCAYNNGGFIVTASGGTPPYNFASSLARESNSTGVFGGLPAGTYDLTVKDRKGKITKDSVKLTGPGTFPYFTSAVVNASACNSNNGQVTLTPAGGTAPYQYSINDGTSFQSSNVFSNLAPGSYSIMIEDANGCITAPWSAVGVSYANFQVWSHASFVNVTAPSCGVTMTVTPSAPACGNNNTLTVTNTSGGTAPYKYSIDGQAFGALPSGGGFSGLSPGTHTVAVMDNAGTTSSYTYTFPNDCAITTTQTPSSCGGSSGTLTVTTASGIPPLTYSIDGTNFQSSATFSGLPKGSYTILVKDAYGVITYGSGNVVAICFGVGATTTPSNCDQSTGSITAKAVNGVGPYTYTLNNPAITNTTGVFSNLPGGYYTITATDFSGQTATTNVAISDQCMSFDTVVQTARCGNANGQITVNTTGGTGPYQYSTTGANPIWGNVNTFPNLLPGTYVIGVKDLHGNVATVTVVVPNVAGPQVSAKPTAASCANNDGTIQLYITGGTAPFNTVFNGALALMGQTQWTGLAQGTYGIAVTDQNGCMDSTIVPVPATDSLKISADTVPATCQGVAVQLPVTSNGASFSWSPATGLSDPSTINPLASPPATTSYVVTATLGTCSRSDTVTVTVLPAPTAAAGPSDTVCPGKSAQLQGSGGIQYLWSPGTNLSDSTVANPTVDSLLSTVTYRLSVKDANGCWSLDSAATTVVVSQPKVFAGNDTAVIVGQPLQLNAIDQSNSGFTSYVWSPPQGLSNPDIANPTTVVTGNITYTVLATTPLGCTATDTIDIGAATTEALIVPNAFTPNNDGHNDLLRVIGYGIQSLKFFRVYDRWGRLVYTSSQTEAGWDGMVGGQPAPAGTYVWSAAAVDYHGKPMEGRGTVILVR